MVRKNDKALTVGLDIGTYKTVAVVAEADAAGLLEVIGLGSHPSRGLKRGVVVDIEATEHSIQRAIEEAELMAGCEIRAVFAGISGNHIRSHNSHGIVAIKDQEVSEADVERVLDAARAVAVPADQRILHVLPQEYLIDSQDGIRQPVGMSGVRLETYVHVVTAAQSAVQNLIKCIARCGLQVDDLILQQIASSRAVLSEDEMDLGVALVDIGAGTSDLAIYAQGALRHTACIPIAGDLVTHDIAVALRTPTQHAEEIKIKYACAVEQLARSDENIQVPSVGERPPRRLARQALAQVVEARYREILTMIQTELRRSGYENMVRAGVVLTGGAARTEGVVELAEEIFHLPVRIGVAQGLSGLSEVLTNPAYSAAAGFLLHGSGAAHPELKLGRSAARDVWARFRNWFRGEF